MGQEEYSWEDFWVLWNIGKFEENCKIDGLKKYIAEVVCEQIKDDNSHLVTKLLKILAARYLKTKYKCEIYKSKDSNETDPVRFFKKVKTVAGQLMNEKIMDNINFILLVMMLRKGKSSGALTEYERLKIEGKRDLNVKSPHYGNYGQERRQAIPRPRFIGDQQEETCWEGSEVMSQSAGGQKFQQSVRHPGYFQCRSEQESCLAFARCEKQTL